MRRMDDLRLGALHLLAAVHSKIPVFPVGTAGSPGARTGRTP